MTSPRNVIITGAGSGIGASTAAHFAAAGDRVFLADVSTDRLEQTRAGLDSALVSTHTVDVTNSKAVTDLVAQVIETAGTVDVVVSNAGVFDGCAGVQQTTPELWERVVGINLTGAFNVVKATAEPMISQANGRIILVGSIAAQRAMPDGLAYCATKAGLEGMTRRLAYDLGSYGITANLVAPGVVRTGIRATSEEILGDLVPDTDVGVGTDQDLMDKLIPLKRGGDPEEIAATIFFLASTGAGYISGEVIHVDGGWIAS